MATQKPNGGSALSVFVCVCVCFIAGFKEIWVGAGSTASSLSLGEVAKLHAKDEN